MSNPETIPYSTLDAVCASKDYHTAQISSKLEKQRIETASNAYERAKIRERFEEIRCQHEPLAGILKSLGIELGSPQYDPTRKAIVRAAFFVVFGHNQR
jgi:hypothetical protein